jgi:hypothetical protein
MRRTICSYGIPVFRWISLKCLNFEPDVHELKYVEWKPGAYRGISPSVAQLVSLPFVPLRRRARLTVLKYSTDLVGLLPSSVGIRSMPKASLALSASVRRTSH